MRSTGELYRDGQLIGGGGERLPLPPEWVEYQQWVAARNEQLRSRDAEAEPLSREAARAVNRLLDTIKRLLSGDDPITSQLAAAGWWHLREVVEVRDWWGGVDFRSRVLLIREGWGADRGGSIAAEVPAGVWRRLNRELHRLGLVDSPHLQ